jgi:hypothetical protein
LQVEWFVWRGPGAVTFSPSVVGADKGPAEATATFSKPGEYVLRACDRRRRHGDQGHQGRRQRSVINPAIKAQPRRREGAKVFLRVFETSWLPLF